MTNNEHWWPEQLSLKALRRDSALGDPLGGDFDYAEAVRIARCRLP